MFLIECFLSKHTTGTKSYGSSHFLSVFCLYYKGENSVGVSSESSPSSNESASAFMRSKNVFLRWIKPPTTSLVLGTLADLEQGNAELIAENALLRHQLIILRRQIKRPVYRKTDRLLLVLLARMVWTWKQALFLVQPETLLRWHRELFRLFWKHKSKAHSRKPRLSPETISLIKEMAANNRLWGAERIRGELLKLDIRVSKRTIQKYMKQTRPKRASWTELENVPTQSCGRGMGL